MEVKHRRRPYLSCPTHCCPKHGCKYGYNQCPVATGQVEPVSPMNNGCEQCEYDHAELRRLADTLEEMFVKDKDEKCRACDNTGWIPGNYMGDSSTLCRHCGRGTTLTTILKRLREGEIDGS